MAIPQQGADSGASGGGSQAVKQRGGQLPLRYVLKPHPCSSTFCIGSLRFLYELWQMPQWIEKHSATILQEEEKAGDQ